MTKATKDCERMRASLFSRAMAIVAHRPQNTSARIAYQGKITNVKEIAVNTMVTPINLRFFDLASFDSLVPM